MHEIGMNMLQNLSRIQTKEREMPSGSSEGRINFRMIAAFHKSLQIMSNNNN
jgi:hypothetical protein